MFRFLHAADLHLDSPLRGLERYDGCPADEVRKASRRALENLVDLALAERVAFVLIAGDVFDGDLPDYGACLFLNEQMLKLRDAKINVYLIRGNHDAESHMTRHLRLPDNVYAFPTDRAGSHVLDSCGVVIHGQGFATKAVVENLTSGYPRADVSLFNIGLLHTCVEGREGHERYAPCSVSDMRSKHYDYWALGHIHTREVLSNASEPPIVFAGNLQGRHVRETGAKGAMLVEVGDDGLAAKLEHRALDVMRWSVLRVDASGAKTEEDVIERARAQLTLAGEQTDGLPTAVRLEIVGACPAHNRLASRAEWLANTIRAEAQNVGSGRLWIEKVPLRTRPEADHGQVEGSLRVLLDHINALRADETRLAALGKELADLKKKLPSSWGDGSRRREVDDPAHLREVLDRVEPELLMGLIADGGAS